MGQKDMAEKLLEEYEDVFADIVNVLLFNGRQMVKPENLKPIGIKSHYKADDGKLHEQERDVAKLEKRNGVGFVLYGLENQEKIDKYMPLRVFGYEGASYRSQYVKKEIKPYPVVTVILYFGERHWRYEKNLKSFLNIPFELEEYVNDIKINVFEISWLTKGQIELFQSDFKIIADFFVQKRKNKNYEPSTQEIKHVDAFLKMMSAFTHDTRYEDSIEIIKKEGGPITMCTVLDAREAKGLQQGIQQGLQQGAIALVNTLRTLEQTNDFIVSRLMAEFGFSEAEAKSYL